MIRLGLCTDIANIREAEAAGFDYVEGKLNAIAALDAEAYSDVLALVKGSGIKVERCCLLLPKSMSVIGGAYDERAMVEYLHGAFSRMRELGADIVVFGSGKSRNIPQGVRWQDAFLQLVAVTKTIGGVAAGYGIRIAIEPLNRMETNLINTLAEGAALQAEVDMVNVGLLADAFHMRREGEPLERISLVSPLMHAHMAMREGRAYPVEADAEVTEFFSALKASGYDGSVSIEGKSDDWRRDSVAAITAMRPLC